MQVSAETLQECLSIIPGTPLCVLIEDDGHIRPAGSIEPHVALGSRFPPWLPQDFQHCLIGVEDVFSDQLPVHLLVEGFQPG